MIDHRIEDVMSLYGFSEEVFLDYRFMAKGKKSIYLVSRYVEELPEAYHQGLPFLRIQTRYPKMTSIAAVKFGKHAVRNIVELTTQEQLQKYFNRKYFSVESAQLIGAKRETFVIVTYQQSPLGMGFLSPNLELVSLLPKAWLEYKPDTQFLSPLQLC